MAATYLEDFNRVLRQRREDYRLACTKKISWSDYVKKWGTA